MTNSNDTIATIQLAIIQTLHKVGLVFEQSFMQKAYLCKHVFNAHIAQC